MSVIKSIADLFRSTKTPPKTTHDGQQIDVLGPVMQTRDYLKGTLDLLMIMMLNDAEMAPLKDPKSEAASHNQVVIKAYRDYVKGLPSSLSGEEAKEPLITVEHTLAQALLNVEQIEDEYHNIFNFKHGEDVAENMRTSTLIIIGYLETVNQFASWVGSIVRHLTKNNDDLIAPFETKTMDIKAKFFGEFAGVSHARWDGKHGSIVKTISDLHKRGADVVIKANDTWLDTFIHDSSFSQMEQELLSNSFRNPIMMLINDYTSYQQEEVELMESRKEWLIAKISFENEKMRGLDHESPEYKKLQKITQHYADKVSMYEQKIARMRHG